MIHSSLQAHTYNAFVVSPEFLEGAPIDPDLFFARSDNLYPKDKVSPTVQDALDAQAQCNSWDHLTNAECISTYSQAFLLDRSDVVVVARVSNATNSVFWAAQDGNIFLGAGGSWICGETDNCHVSDPQRRPDPLNWNVSAFTEVAGYYTVDVDHCLSRPMPDLCTVSANLPLLITVIICNVAKLLGFGLVLWVCKEEPIVTIGDAVKSFLDKDDPTTVGRSLYETEDFGINWTDSPAIAKPYRRRRRFWISSVGSLRFWVSMLW